MAVAIIMTAPGSQTPTVVAAAKVGVVVELPRIAVIRIAIARVTRSTIGHIQRLHSSTGWRQKGSRGTVSVHRSTAAAFVVHCGRAVTAIQVVVKTIATRA